MKKRFLTIQMLMLVFIAHSLFAAETPQNLLIVRGNGFWPPYEWIEDDVLQGFHIDLVKEVATKLNLNIQFRSYPWKRAIKMIKDGKADAITYLARTEEREQFALYFKGNELHLARVGFFALKKNKHNIQYSGKLEQLKNYRLCTLLGQTYGKEFEKATYLQKDDVKTEELLLKKLIKGRCQLAAGYIDDYRIAVKQMGIDNDLIHFFTPYLSEHPMYFAFSKAKKHEALAKRFAEVMKIFKTTTRYQELLQKYGLNEDNSKQE